MNRLALCAAPVALMMCSAAPAAYAQNAQAGPAGATVIDDVVVTARRTTERLQDVPIAVTAVSGEALDRRGASNISDVQTQIPNATFYAFGGSNNNASVYLRGVGQADQLFMFDPGVGIYLDDAYIGRAQGALFETVDIARVEVLRGPQGTLYGKNTSGGALKVYTRDPDLISPGGQATVTTGNYDLLSIKLSGETPIVDDRVGVRASVLRVVRDGFVDNLLTGDDMQDRDYLGGQVTVLARVTDRLTARLTADGMRDRSTPAAPTPVVAVSFPPNLPPFSAQDPLKPRQSRADTPVRNDQDSFGLNGQLTWDGDRVQIKAITSYRDLSFDQAFDYDSLPYLLLSSNQKQNTDQFSGELQANFNATESLSFVSGLYYFTENTDSVILVPSNLPLEVAPGNFIAINNTFTQITDLNSESYAAYFNLVWELTDRLSLSGGVRYTFDKKDYRSSLTNNVFTTSNFSYDISDDWSQWLPKIALDFRLTPDQLIYASYGTGFKSGGFNPRAAVADVAAPFDPETSETFELGYKSSFNGGRVIFNAAAFYSVFDDYQTNLIALIGTPPSPTAYFTNAGGYKSWGLEGELTLRLSNGLTLSGQAAVLDGEFDTFLNPIIGDFADKRLPNAPKFSTSVNGHYVRALSDDVDLILDGDIAYRGASFTNIANNPNLHRDSYVIANARVAFALNSHGVEIFGGVRNLTNETYLLDGVDYVDATYNFRSHWYNDPRTIYAGVRYTF